MQIVKSVSRGAVSLFTKEHNDCTVRALSNASKMSYEDAHALLKKYGRKQGKGAYYRTMLAAYNEAGFEVMAVYGNTESARFAAYASGDVEHKKGVTLKKLLPSLKTGEYIVNVTRHALAVVDGEIIDTFDNKANIRVVSVFKKVK